MYEIHTIDSIEPKRRVLILDTALHVARQLSREAAEVLSVVRVDKARRIRAFADKGVVFWAVRCRSCNANPESTAYCLECTGTGYTRGDTLTP